MAVVGRSCWRWHLGPNVPGVGWLVLLGHLRRCRWSVDGSDVTRWNEDPFACGSYSFAAVGSTPGMRADLAMRWDAVVFAGEAVSTSYPATMQGAYQSGIQAAQTLLV